MHNKTNVRELVLYAVNDGDLYRRHAQPIMRNMAKKIAAGKYDAKLAVKAWRHFADAAARKYGREFGSGERDGLSMFSTGDREQAAKKMVSYYSEETRDLVKQRRKPATGRRRKNPSDIYAISEDVYRKVISSGGGSNLAVKVAMYVNKAKTLDEAQVRAARWRELSAQHEFPRVLSVLASAPRDPFASMRRRGLANPRPSKYTLVGVGIAVGVLGVLAYDRIRAA